ncbi:MAG: membrane integrity-associated transporter subunit PqiC [Sinobacteraceae bacterium]|nr:membrane integrity-associated transporter subunit PqiC [Nevskiaceae bacterium]
MSRQRSAVRVHALAASCTAAMLSGCSGLHSHAQPAEVYVLRFMPAVAAASAQRTASLSIRVARPDAAPGLNSEHIVILQPDHRMNYYAASVWAAPLPEVVEELVVESLRASGSWAAVQDSRGFFPADYLLQIVVRRFDAEYVSSSAAPQVQVTLDCTLGRRNGRDPPASFSVQGSAPASANQLHEVVSAFELATNQALTELTARSSAASRADQNADMPVPSITR